MSYILLLYRKTQFSLSTRSLDISSAISAPPPTDFRTAYSKLFCF